MQEGQRLEKSVLSVHGSQKAERTEAVFWQHSFGSFLLIETRVETTNTRAYRRRFKESEIMSHYYWNVTNLIPLQYKSLTPPGSWGSCSKFQIKIR